MYAPALRALALKILNKSKLDHICMILKAPGHWGAAFIFQVESRLWEQTNRSAVVEGQEATPPLSRFMLMQREPGSPEGPKAPGLG